MVARHRAPSEVLADVLEEPKGDPRAEAVEELGSRLHTERGQSLGGRDPDPPSLVIEAVAVLPEGMRSHPERLTVDQDRRRRLRLRSRRPALLQVGDESRGQVGPARQVQRIDTRDQLHY